MHITRQLCRHLLGNPLADSLAVPHERPALATPILVRTLTGLVTAAMLAAPASPLFAKESPKPLYATTIENYPSPKLTDVDGREYKILLDPAKTSSDMPAAFADLWGRIKAAAAKQGFKVTEKEKNPLAIEFSTKEYFDTKDQALWGKGYLIRITTRYKDGKPADAVTATSHLNRQPQ